MFTRFSRVYKRLLFHSLGPMIPLGYFYKQVLPKPDYLQNKSVVSIFSVSGCISDDFCDYVNHWKHNKYWYFDSPELMNEIIEIENISTDNLKLFFYYAYEEQYDEVSKTWSPYPFEPSFSTNIKIPSSSTFEGYDITSSSTGQFNECSPLSCNGLADEIPVNLNCLIPTLDEALELFRNNKLQGCEPGPYRVIEVHSVARA